MYDWSFSGSVARASEQPAAVGDDPRVVAGGEALRPRPAREREQLARSGKPPLQRVHGFGVSPRA